MAERSRARPQGEEGFDRCWYPVLPAAELDVGQVVGLPFLDGRVRFREDQLVGSDAALGRFLKYVRSYPRAHPSRDLIT